MLLKRATISGFKSFADQVSFTFGAGVTCIVGPNGCGKSNIVDATKWVLGEQSARSLRGRQMLDMIFSGSSTRRSSSVARVDLVFDNSDRKLTLDMDEVTVSRKLYRSGESEYLLNNQSTRLKDIRELFMDTGIGTEAYTIIEQGKVDVLLQSSPIERRVIFEEAAGISKFKARKREAERKLERTDQNLLRVADIVEELEKRLRSVKLQAGKARNFLEYQSRLNELKASFSLAEYHRLTEDIDRLNRKAAEHTDRVTELSTTIDRHEAGEIELATRLDRVAEEISQTDSRLIQANSEVSAQEERLTATKIRKHEQQGLLEGALGRAGAGQARLEETESQVEEVRSSVSALDDQIRELKGSIAAGNEEDAALAREVTQAQGMLEDEKGGIIELLRKSAQAHNEITRLNEHRQSLVGQKGRLSTRDAQLTAELQESLGAKAELRQRVGELEELITKESSKLDDKKSESARVAELKRRLADELAQTKEDRSALTSRLDLLNDLERRKEGIGAGVRKLLEAKESGAQGDAFDCIKGLVADAFEADVEHAPIIDAVLGEWDQYLVVDSSEAFLRCQERVGGLPGRVTALCIDRLPPLITDRPLVDHPGIIGRAIDLVRFSDDMRLVAGHLLGRTIVVDSLDTARALAKEDVAGHRFVTRAGEVVEPDGRISVGPPTVQAGLISRKSQLRELAVQAGEIEEQIEKLADQLNRTEAEADHLDRMQQELRGAIYQCNTAKVEAKAALANIDDSIRRLTDERPLVSQEVTVIEQQIAEVMQKSEEGGKSLEQLEQQNEEREQLVARRQVDIDALVDRRREVQGRLTEAKVSAGQLQEKRSSAEERIRILRSQMGEVSESIEAAQRDADTCRRHIEEAERSLASGQEALKDLKGQIESLERTSADLREQREKMRLEQEQLGQAIKTARTGLSQSETELHQCQMALAETNVRRSELTARVQAELEIDLVERYEAYEHTQQDWKVVEEEIADLRGKIDRLGNVNLDAIKELEELQERLDFLVSQRDDLAVSIRQLQQLIARLDDESRERFAAMFTIIRENFRTLFRKLFGGGKADIILEDPENPLDCGIEILAQPPGKDLQSISLMSGGEKTMTAIALLMSIFKTRPAPFAILDEVDAALDEANNERFNQIINEFVSESQFIIITHSKRTMNIADTLYGVTMQEPGVSSLVSVQLADVGAA